MSDRDHDSVEAFERVMSNEMVAAYGTKDRAFQREETADGWRYWCAGTESAYKKFLAGWTAAVIAAQDSGQAQKDGDMYWDADDPERFAATDLHGAIEYMMDDYPDSDMPMALEFHCAKRMPNVRVLVTARSDADGYVYEVIDAARKGEGGAT